MLKLGKKILTQRDKFISAIPSVFNMFKVMDFDFYHKSRDGIVKSYFKHVHRHNLLLRFQRLQQNCSFNFVKTCILSNDFQIDFFPQEAHIIADDCDAIDDNGNDVDVSICLNMTVCFHSHQLLL